MNCTNIEFHTAALMADSRSSGSSSNCSSSNNCSNTATAIDDGNNKAAATTKCNQHVFAIVAVSVFFFLQLMCKALIGRSLTAKMEIMMGPRLSEEHSNTSPTNN